MITPQPIRLSPRLNARRANRTTNARKSPDLRKYPSLFSPAHFRSKTGERGAGADETQGLPQLESHLVAARNVAILAKGSGFCDCGKLAEFAGYAVLSRYGEMSPAAGLGLARRCGVVGSFHSIPDLRPTVDFPHCLRGRHGRHSVWGLVNPLRMSEPAGKVSMNRNRYTWKAGEPPDSPSPARVRHRRERPTGAESWANSALQESPVGVAVVRRQLPSGHRTAQNGGRVCCVGARMRDAWELGEGGGRCRDLWGITADHDYRLNLAISRACGARPDKE